MIDALWLEIKHRYASSEAANTPYSNKKILFLGATPVCSGALQPVLGTQLLQVLGTVLPLSKDRVPAIHLGPSRGARFQRHIWFG